MRVNALDAVILFHMFHGRGRGVANKLAQYMLSKSMKDKDFLAAITPYLRGKRVSERTVENWRQGRSMPRKAALEAIRAATGGEVMPNDFLIEGDA